VNINLGVESDNEGVLEIFNTLGEKVYARNLSNFASSESSIEIATGSFESGVYLIRLQTGNKNFKQRLIIK